MKFGKIFSRNPQATSSTLQPAGLMDDYQSEYTFDKLISSEIAARLLTTINSNIAIDVARYGASVMNPSMELDLSRMNYYINGEKISVPGAEYESKINYSTHIMEPQNHWIQEHIGTLSSFLHQGIFPDFFGAAGLWTSTSGKVWDIRMVSLNRAKTQNYFYISNTGVIKIISQAQVKNVILNKVGIVVADVTKSYFSLQLSFRIIKDSGKCQVTAIGQDADYCRLHVCGNGLA